MLRIVPDDTKFDFMRFRRISFPVSAVLSIFAIALYFFHGLNFGIDFIGGTLIEVQSKAGPADLAKMRSTLSGLNLGDVQLQQFGGPTDVLIRVAQQPGGDAAQQAAVVKVREAVGTGSTSPRRVVGPRVSTARLLDDPVLAIFAIPDYLVPFRMAVRARRHRAYGLVRGLHVAHQIDFDLSSIAALLTSSAIRSTTLWSSTTHP
jgi:preprotein translocase subunit SecF